MAAQDLDFPPMDGIKPAYAGLLADWSIGLREVTAALIDLALRGVLYVQADRISVVGNTGALAGFEKNLLELIFRGGESATYSQIREAYANSQKLLVKAVCDGAVEEGLIRPDFQGILAQNVKAAMTEVLGPLPKIPDNAVRLNAPTWILSAFKPLIPGFGEIEDKIREKSGGSHIDLILTAEGRRQRDASQKLKHVLEQRPLTEERLADEYVAYAVAYGIGDRWLKRLGGRHAQLAVLIEQTGEANATKNLMDLDAYLREIFG